MKRIDIPKNDIFIEINKISLKGMAKNNQQNRKAFQGINCIYSFS